MAATASCPDVFLGAEKKKQPGLCGPSLSRRSLRVENLTSLSVFFSSSPLAARFLMALACLAAK
jgi:hypothetical protein